MTSPARHVLAEIATQPEMWSRAVETAAESTDLLPAKGERVAMVGCGTSWFMAMYYAVAREQAGQGLTDAFAASEFPYGRDYDRIIALTRSGTTSEVLDLLGRVRGKTPTLAIIGDPETPGATAADQVIKLPYADEKSVVQTRFATSALAMLRASLGEDLTGAIADCRTALDADIPSHWLDMTHFTYLGHGSTVGLSHEAALKMREAAIAWSEAYPAFDYRHGPIAVADPKNLVWFFGQAPDGLVGQVKATGAQVHLSSGDPMADLVLAQRFAIALALHRGYDPDSPRNLTRSIILDV